MAVCSGIDGVGSAIYRDYHQYLLCLANFAKRSFSDKRRSRQFCSTALTHSLTEPPIFAVFQKFRSSSSTTCLSCRVILFKNLTSIFDGKVPADLSLLLIAGCFPGNDFCGQVPFRGKATGQALSG